MIIIFRKECTSSIRAAGRQKLLTGPVLAQAHALSQTTLSRMSKSQQSGTARNYVESIVKDQDTETLLSESQPQYDPNKKPAAPSSSSEPASQTSSTSTQKERTFHRATFNPIASEEVAADAATAPQADVQWGPREFLKQREEIKETAQLACADLEVELLDCFKTGHMWEKSNLCNDQRNRFWACFNKCRVRLLFIPCA